MAVQKVHIAEFLDLAQRFPVMDVRSPGEFAQGHIPGAYNLPLFSDPERKIVGTTYKQVDREAAIKIGLDFFGPKMRQMVVSAEEIRDNHPGSQQAVPAASNLVLVHCWRGGIRSAALAWLLDLYGFKVYTLTGGYKSYRKWVRDTYSSSFPVHLLGGYTGSGKTYVLQQLRKQLRPVLDLEALASHKGSAFGNIGLPEQPAQEHFENLLAREFNLLGISPGIPYTGPPIWLEDESQRIGLVNIPTTLWQTMREAPLYFLEISFEERLRHIVEEYGGLEQEKMMQAIQRISKRLGGLETKMALEAMRQQRLEDCFRILLTYYDKWYRKGLHNRPALAQQLVTCPSPVVDAERNATLIAQLQTQKV